MDRGYTILRMTKHQNAGAARSLEAHHERKKKEYQSNPDIITELSHLNFHYIQPEQSYKKAIEGRIAEAAEENPAMLVRSNSVRFIDVLITGSPMFFTLESNEKKNLYFNTAMEFMKEKVGERNIVASVVHLDEKSPHMHLIFVPITKDNRLSAKEIIGGPKGLTQWQDEFHSYMAERIPGLQRGRSKRLTGREHIPTQTLKALSEVQRPDKRLALVSETKTLRQYVDSIPPHLRREIEEEKKRQRARQLAERQR
jgi:hypothetical protein